MVVQVDNLLVGIAPLPVSAALMGEIIFTGTADGNVQSVQVRIDNRTWENADDTSNNTYRTWQHAINTTNLSNGVHHLEARAYDGSRYSTLSGLDFSVLNPKKTTKPGARFIPGMESAVTALAASIVLILASRRRVR